MFERFTGEARTVVQRAEREAGALGHDRIGPEHLLIAIAAEPGEAGRVLAGLGLSAEALRASTGPADFDAEALAAIGIDLAEVRRRVEASFGAGALAGGRGGRRPFAPASKKALELALREAIALGDRHIDAGHILLGLTRDPDDAVAALLLRCGRSAAAVRAALLAARPRAA